jgi:hypothetical protein
LAEARSVRELDVSTVKMNECGFGTWLRMKSLSGTATRFGKLVAVLEVDPVEFFRRPSPLGKIADALKAEDRKRYSLSAKK